MNNRILLFLFWSVSIFESTAQLKQSDRFEILLNENDQSYYEVVSLQERGLIIHRRIIGKGEDQMEFIRLDTSFHELWRGYIPIHKSIILVGSEIGDDLIVMLFKDFSKGLANFLITVISLTDSTFGHYNVDTPFSFNSSLFKVVGNSALIAGYYNSRPLVLHYDFISKKSKIIPGFFNDSGELTQILTAEDGSFEILVISRNLERKKSVWIRNYTNQGELVNTTIINPAEKLHLNFGLSSRLPDGTHIVSGIYGRNREYSQGVFIAKILDYGEYDIKYYSFGELGRFFNYMKAKRESRIKNRIERKKIRGKKIKLSYRLLIHELIPNGNEYILIGEAYYPHYIPYSRSSFRYTGSLLPNSGQMVFDGYQYTHAVVIGIGPNGELLWDNSFEINDVRTFKLQQYVNIKPEADRVLLSYIHNNIIRTKIIQGQEILEGKSFERIKPKFEQDEIINQVTDVNKLVQWFGEYYYAYGVQRVSNTVRPGVNLNRKVFFINKIIYK